MLDSFHDYLSKHILDFFNKNPPKKGNKFLINFENKSDVDKLYFALKDKGSREFNYKDEQMTNIYKTFYLPFGDVKLVVANSNVNPDFLVKLRNKTSSLKGEWKNNALLIISEKIKDSINDATENLQDENYPLNINYIKKSFEDEIKKSFLEEFERDILKEFIDNNQEENELYKSNIWDFKSVLSVLNNGCIQKEDYKGLNLFYDSGLFDKDSKDRRTRLKENTQLYNKIRDINIFENHADEYETFLDKKGRSLLKNLGDDWFKADFKVLKKSEKDFQNSKKKIKFLGSNIENNLVIWDKSKKDTQSGRRNRNIIIFNNSNDDEIKIEFKLEGKLSKSYLWDDISKKEGFIRENKLIFKFKVDSNIVFKKYRYRHNDMTSNDFRFNICVLNCDYQLLSSIKDIYTIEGNKIIINQNNGFISFDDENDNVISINNNDIVEPKSTIDVNQSFVNIVDNIINFSLSSNGMFIPFSIKKMGHSNLIISTLDVWGKKIKNKQDFVLENDSLKQGDNVYNFQSDEFRKIIDLENQIISKSIISGKYVNEKLIKSELNLSPEMESAYSELFDYFKSKNNVPSLVYLDENLKKIYLNILNIFNKEVEEINEGDRLQNSNKKDLFKLGVIEHNDTLKFSSISILNLAFQLEISNQCGDEYIGNNILKRLVPNNLMPFIYNSRGEVYKAIIDSPAKEWIVYDTVSRASIGTTDVFIDKIVYKKLHRFTKYFGYLFNENSNAPLIINLINIENDKKVIKGIFKFIRERLPDKRKTGGIIPVEVNIYNENNKTYFDEFFNCESIDDFDNNFDIEIKDGELDALDIIRLVQDNINYYIHDGSSNEYGYAHISFYKMLTVLPDSDLEMSKIDTGIVLDGLLSSIPSSYDGGYRSGFGIKYANEKNTLVKTAKNINELAYNMSSGSKLYVKDKSIATLYDDEHIKLNQLFEDSHWVTFIEPTFGLDYFSNGDKLFIIHYSDQYSSSSQYDTITVTSKVDPYEEVITEFLDSSDFGKISYTPNDIQEIIQIFNSVNGEWLLNVISKDNVEVEKLSIISAIKYSLSIFNHEDIVWIPISMEEILRVAGNTGLSEKEGLFSVRVLKGDKKGRYSDDFLMMGFNIKTHEMYYYPVEVKMGVNPKKYLEKGKEQINTTSTFIKEYLVDGYSDDAISPFRKKFYRNFFVQLYLANVQKFVSNNIWVEKNMGVISNFKKIFLDDDYIISDKLEPIIGKGALISFKKNSNFQYYHYDADESITTIEFPMVEGKRGIINSIQSIDNKIRNGELDFDFEDFLYNSKISEIDVGGSGLESGSSSVDVGGSGLESGSSSVDVGGSGLESGSSSVDVGGSGLESGSSSVDVGGSGLNKECDIDIEKIKIKLGTVIGENKEIFWDFGDSKKGNRHMLIQGQSGQGKTYFIQKLIKELSDYQIPCLVIDYTNSFGSRELDNSLRDYLGERLEEHYVRFDQFPLNPFKRYVEEDERDGSFTYQSNAKIAGRLKSIFTSVFGLGQVQARKLNKAIKRGLVKYGDDMDLNMLELELENDGSKEALGALTRIEDIFEEDLFKKENSFDWSIFDSRSSKVVVIQLNKLINSNKSALTEMILWDLWYYKEEFGKKDIPFAVILDEAHNLDFKKGSPSYSILKEGRKYGWAAILATQSVKGIMAPEEMASLDQARTKVFFHPDDNSINYISNLLSSDAKTRKNWEYKLRDLELGQCIIHDGGNKVYPIDVDTIFPNEQ